MCGFLISINKKKIDKNSFSKAFKKMINRGPDSQKEGSFEHNGLFFNYGFARLSIRDPNKRSDQPFISKEKNLLFFNGEIYNSNELKKKNQIITKTKSDTEILSVLINRHKEKTLNKLNGMWALANIDLKASNILISRDRYGVKPLYYYHDEKQLIISSTIISIKTLIKEKAKINYYHFQEYLQNNINYAEKNIFLNIKKFKNSSFTSFDLKKWKFRNTNEYFKIKNYKRQNKFNLYEDFKSSVKRRLISDRPICLMLSGGLDSSLILSCLKYLNKTKNITAYVGYIDKQSNDFIYAKKIINQTKIKKRFVKINNKNFSLNEFKNICKNQETLFPLFGNVLSSYQIYKNIKKSRSKVVLDGSGGDELFCGYPNRYFYFYLNELFKKDLFKFFKQLNFNVFKNYIKFIIKIYFPGIAQIFKNKYVKGKYFKISDPIYSKNLSLNKALQTDAFSGRLPHYLHQLDRNSMAFGLENRSPFLDRSLIKYLFSNFDNKVDNTLYKKELRNLFQKFSPLDTSKRTDKSGFSFGKDKFLKKHYKKFMLKISKSKILKELIFLNQFINDSHISKLSNPSYLNFFSRLCVIVIIEETIINS